MGNLTGRRRSIRLKGYDYSQSGAYFVTVCTQNRECLFGEIVNQAMRLNDAGRMVQVVWNDLTSNYPGIEIGAFVIMPNHIHGIIIIHGRRGERQDQGEHKVRPYGTRADSLGRVVQGFKSKTTHEYIGGVKQQGWAPFTGKLWQRNYYERIVRGDEELNRIRKYILENPRRWDMDLENPARAMDPPMPYLTS